MCVDTVFGFTMRLVWIEHDLDSVGVGWFTAVHLLAGALVLRVETQRTWGF